MEVKGLKVLMCQRCESPYGSMSTTQTALTSLRCRRDSAVTRSTTDSRYTA